MLPHARTCVCVSEMDSSKREGQYYVKNIALLRIVKRLAPPTGGTNCVGREPVTAAGSVMYSDMLPSFVERQPVTAAGSVMYSDMLPSFVERQPVTAAGSVMYSDMLPSFVERQPVTTAGSVMYSGTLRSYLHQHCLT